MVGLQDFDQLFAGQIAISTTSADDTAPNRSGKQKWLLKNEPDLLCPLFGRIGTDIFTIEEDNAGNRIVQSSHQGCGCCFAAACRTDHGVGSSFLERKTAVAQNVLTFAITERD